MRTATAADGTMLHAPLGVLPYDADEDRVQCHLCGGWYRALAPAHLRRHEVNAEDYRALAGLKASLALTSPSLSQLRRRQLEQRIASDERIRAGMQRGDALARSGELQAQASATARERGQRVQRARALRDSGQRLGRARATAYHQQREVRAQRLGFDTLEDYLRTRYVHDHWRIDDLARELEISLSALRGELARYAIQVRPRGPAGR